MDNEKGLYHRYKIEKTNGNPVDPLAEYFVLRLDRNGTDTIHIEAGRKAILVYAEEIKDHLPELAKDLRSKYGSPNIIFQNIERIRLSIIYEMWSHGMPSSDIKGVFDSSFRVKDLNRLGDWTEDYSLTDDIEFIELIADFTADIYEHDEVGFRD